MKKKLSKNLFELELESLIRMGLYANREDAIRDAIRNLLVSRADLRLNIAIDLLGKVIFPLGRHLKGQVSE